MKIELGSDVVDRLNKKTEVSLEFILSTLVIDIAQFLVLPKFESGKY